MRSKNPNRKDIKKLYVNEGLSVAKIAEIHGISSSTIRRRLIEKGVRIRSREATRRPLGEELRRLYIDQGLAAYKISEIYDVANTTVARWLKKEGMKIRNNSEAQLSKRGATRPSDEELSRLYIDEGMNTTEIAKKYSITQTTVPRWLREAGIKIRSRHSYIKSPEQFIQETQEALSIVSLASVTENTGDIARILIQAWPDRFPSEEELAKMLPGIVKRTGEALTPFTLDRAGYHTREWATLPTEVKYCLEDLVYSIVQDQYQISFNDDPEATLEELRSFARRKSEVQGLAKRVLSHYKEVYAFSIPGHGKMMRAA